MKQKKKKKKIVHVSGRGREIREGELKRMLYMKFNKEMDLFHYIAMKKYQRHSIYLFMYLAIL